MIYDNYRHRQKSIESHGHTTERHTERQTAD
jgi:hypothetical protein